ncbi:alanine racemase [Gallaecimonas sp. GXIMD4217]|uniref:alanine racemase n=1 Tax=Gallaecimonas sp. GXIMD4217 TaxID=3131927 RepID=UPI00311B14B0
MKVATARIDSAALRHNLARVRQLAPHSRVMAVLKANGYGHDQVAVAQYLDGADALAVARLEEALALRGAGIDQPIVMLEGCFEVADLPVMAREGIEAVLHTQEQLAMLKAAELPAPLKVWVKVDTGMHRIGIAPGELDAFHGELAAMDKVQKPIGLLSHYACADEPEHPLNAVQQGVFAPLAEGWAGPVSMANSAAILSFPQSHYDWVRPGLILYGASPMVGQLRGDHGLKPAMHLMSSLIAVKPIKAGDSVGYGAAWRAERDTSIGVVAIGYGDGYPRHARMGTPVWLNGRQVPLVGRVSMDMLTVDLGPGALDRVGDDVELWGPKVPVETVAQCSDTISYELLCNMARRVRYEFF